MEKCVFVYRSISVSYTHLDVYKRQLQSRARKVRIEREEKNSRMVVEHRSISRTCVRYRDSGARVSW